MKVTSTERSEGAKCETDVVEKEEVEVTVVWWWTSLGAHRQTFYTYLADWYIEARIEIAPTGYHNAP